MQSDFISSSRYGTLVNVFVTFVLFTGGDRTTTAMHNYCIFPDDGRLNRK